MARRPGSDDRIEAYTIEHSGEDRLLKQVREESERHRNKHKCDVHPSSPVTGRMLDVLVRATWARGVLEVGCGLGYSAIWLAKAVPKGGRVDTIEQDPIHAKEAAKNFRAAGLDGKVRILRGEAKQVLSKARTTYDFIFEDATYGNKPDHYDDLVESSRSMATSSSPTCSPSNLPSSADTPFENGRGNILPTRRKGPNALWRSFFMTADSQPSSSPTLRRVWR